MRAVLIVFLVLVVVGAGIALFAPSPRTAPISPEETPAAVPPTAPAATTTTFIEVTESCGPHFEGTCLSVRSGPGTNFPTVAKLRTGVVLAVAATTTTDSDGTAWYRVAFNEWIRYPERVSTSWYVAAPYVRAFSDPGTQEAAIARPSLLQQAKERLGLSDGKRIIVDRSDQKLYAYDGDTLFLESPISTGLDLTPTPRGTFTVYKKTPSRYMQGPLPGISDEYYDLPGVPWNMYFTNEGGAIHGAFWHTAFGTQWSHGCVNLPLETAHILYDWTPLGTPVLVRD